MSQTSETILQFGTGRFLRAFADFFLHEAACQGQELGRVVIVQSTGDDVARTINDQQGRYHVLVRGLENGQVIDRAEEITSVSRAISATQQWDDVLKLAKSPSLRFILSNTTEAGYELKPEECPTGRPPPSFPAKLLLVLRERFEAGMPGLTIMPCELIEGNAALLCNELLGLCERWQLSAEFRRWLSEECVWLHTLVDRIVVGPPTDHPLLATDKLLIVAEPFAFWALESKSGAAPFIHHPAITRTPDVKPYFHRKVRILNAAHTALTIKAMKRGFKIVRDAVRDPVLAAWLGRLLFEEIVPSLHGKVEEPHRFAEQTLERFRNPFQEHQFADIVKNHESKMKIRLLPTQAEFEARFGRKPPLLSEVIAEGFAGLGR